MKRILLYAFSITLFCALLSCGGKKEKELENQSKKVDQTVETDSINRALTGDKLLEEIGIDFTELDWEYQEPSINLFRIFYQPDDDFLFTSLSDIYKMSEHPDSIAIPNITGLTFDESKYLHLDSPYRERFLAGTNLSESDSVFVYDYEHNSLASFLVRDLKVVARISYYESSSDDLDYYSYMYGFELDRNRLQPADEYYRHSFVCVGKENPFAKQQLKPMKWTKVDSKRYPTKKLNQFYVPYLKEATKGDTYLSEINGLQYFIQNYHTGDANSYYDTYRRLLVINVATGEIVADEFIGGGEGSSASPLNEIEAEEGIEQWGGKLFKNKKDVAFGFEYASFGCSSLFVMDGTNEKIFINCDNRH